MTTAHRCQAIRALQSDHRRRQTHPGWKHLLVWPVILAAIIGGAVWSLWP